MARYERRDALLTLLERSREPISLTALCAVSVDRISQARTRQESALEPDTAEVTRQIDSSYGIYPGTATQDGGFDLAYLQTRFRVPAPRTDWPGAFVILTGYATTGQQWPEAQNLAADERLRLALVQLGLWHCRVTGYSPHTTHAEPGWAAALAPTAACALGVLFQQDAHYEIANGQLWVVRCATGQRAPVARFLERLD